MASYNDFYNTHLDRAYDVDGYYGAQCWDGYAEYCRYLGVPYAHCTTSGYVKDIWNNRKSNGILNYFDEVSTMKAGDVAVFKEVAGVTPYSHIAIFDSDAGGGYGNFLGQNQGGANGAFNITKLPYSATFATAFRPKSSGSSSSGSSGYKESQLINEHAIATLKYDIQKRRDTPDGLVVETLKTGRELEYTQKWVGNGHRYISWVEYQADGASYRYFVAVNGNEQGTEPWATFRAIDDSSKEEPKEDVKKNVKAWGIDISEHNPDVDIKGYDFVIIRATYGTNTDKLLDENIKKCEENKIPYGLYCYDYALNEEQANEQAEYFLDVVKKYNPTMGVWFDIEDADNYKSKNTALTKENCTRSTKIFCDLMKSKGYYVGVYSTILWFQNYVETDYPKWIAHWDSNSGELESDKSEYGVLHQYTSKPIDKDVSYVDLSAFKSDLKEDEQKPTEDENKPTDKENDDSESDMKKFNGLFKTFIELFKKFLSIFGK